MNSYVSVKAMKSHGNLGIEQSRIDTELREAIEAASRQVDDYCGRYFFTNYATLMFDNWSLYRLRVPDLVSITSLKQDEDLNRTFEVTWAATDYLLEPANADPTSRYNPRSHPYSEIIVDTDNGSKSHFTLGKRAIEINGKWGYWTGSCRAPGGG